MICAVACLVNVDGNAFSVVCPHGAAHYHLLCDVLGYCFSCDRQVEIAICGEIICVFHLPLQRRCKGVCTVVEN